MQTEAMHNETMHNQTNASARDFSVIICAYTEARWDDLVAAVASMHDQTLPPREVIIVIDHNPQLQARAEAALSSTAASSVVVIANRYAQGLSGARNSGIQIAQGEIIAFMDEDAIAAPDWLAQLAAAYTTEQTLGVGGTIDPLWQSGRPGWFPTEFDWVVGCTYRGMPTTTAPVRNLIGCNMSFRRQVFATVGGFRNGIGRIGTRPIGCEETELCIRVNQQMPGARMIYAPQAKVQHRVPAIRANWNYFRNRCYSEGLSKAKIATLVGEQDSLSNEWDYTLRTLPTGMAQGIADAILKLKPVGILRAGAIAAGLLITTFGYLYGKVIERRQRATADNQFKHGASI